MFYAQQRRSRGFAPRRPQQNRFAAKSDIHPSQYVNVAVKPEEETVYAPQNSFADFGLHPQLLSNVSTHGYTDPTPIQDQTIPLLMQGRDVVGIANTGTGKTAAFLLPLIDKVLKNPDQGVLVLAPTRELAVQIFDEYQAFTRGLNLSVCLGIGGKNIDTQVATLRKNPYFVIGTPGRIKDLINRRAFDTTMFTNIVLDEVDRMLDIGFRQDIKFLIAHLPKQRHAAFFSATTNPEVEDIMRSLLTDPVKISVKTRETNHHIHQDVIKLKPGDNKIDVLHNLLTQSEFSKVIVFGRTKHGVNKLEKQLSDRGVRVTAIHGNKSQNARQHALQQFKRGFVQALLATDVAARGIDVDGVTHVINFDEPQSYQDYVHRIGRTGRAGNMGKALTFIV